IAIGGEDDRVAVEREAINDVGQEKAGAVVGIAELAHVEAGGDQLEAVCGSTVAQILYGDVERVVQACSPFLESGLVDGHDGAFGVIREARDQAGSYRLGGVDEF